MSVENDVRDHLIEQHRWRGRREELTDDYPLIEGGVVDSMGIFQLVSMIESRYGVEVDDEELVRDNFETLRAIARLVGSKVDAS
jgi:acyl carrier protein